MRYILFCEDKADSEALRLANREDHLAWAATQTATIKLAGPMLSDDGEHMVGSLFILEADSIAAVRAFNRADPYSRAGLWGNVVIRPFRQVIPAS
jgi:uncharacterized protein YciI